MFGVLEVDNFLCASQVLPPLHLHFCQRFANIIMRLFITPVRHLPKMLFKALSQCIFVIACLLHVEVLAD